jgi:hypothetical protein
MRWISNMHRIMSRMNERIYIIVIVKNNKNEAQILPLEEKVYLQRGNS